MFSNLILYSTNYSLQFLQDVCSNVMNSTLTNRSKGTWIPTSIPTSCQLGSSDGVAASNVSIKSRALISRNSASLDTRFELICNWSDSNIIGENRNFLEEIAELNRYSSFRKIKKSLQIFTNSRIFFFLFILSFCKKFIIFICNCVIFIFNTFNNFEYNYFL